MRTTTKVEQFWFGSPRGRLDGETMAFIACQAREALDRGDDQ
jgi:hypothetical protein